MPDISINHVHELPHQAAKAAAQAVADQMAEEYEVATEWQGDVLLFRRDGISGTLALRGKEALLEISLGLFLKAFAPMIEEKVSRKIRKVFGG